MGTIVGATDEGFTVVLVGRWEGDAVGATVTGGVVGDSEMDGEVVVNADGANDVVAEDGAADGDCEGLTDGHIEVVVELGACVVDEVVGEMLGVFEIGAAGALDGAAVGATDTVTVGEILEVYAVGLTESFCGDNDGEFDVAIGTGAFVGILLSAVGWTLLGDCDGAPDDTSVGDSVDFAVGDTVVVLVARIVP